MVLLRKVIGDALRARRLGQRRTLREVSTAANVSLGYLSEIERGHKEASSELLAAICDALGAPLSEMLTDVSATMALAEQMAVAEQMAEVAALPERAAAERVPALPERETVARETVALEAVALEAALDLDAALDQALSEGDVTVQVHSDGPLRTRLTAKRVPPGQRYTESLYVG
jgi:transcriptional regulator with XRE-family HTH domain